MLSRGRLHANEAFRVIIANRLPPLLGAIDGPIFVPTECATFCGTKRGDFHHAERYTNDIAATCSTKATALGMDGDQHNCLFCQCCYVSNITSRYISSNTCPNTLQVVSPLWNALPAGERQSHITHSRGIYILFMRLPLLPYSFFHQPPGLGSTKWPIVSTKIGLLAFTVSALEVSEFGHAFAIITIALMYNYSSSSV